MSSHDSDDCSGSFVAIPLDDLSNVSGGANPFAGIANFFNSLFAPVVNYVKGSVGGVKLANKMYGKSTWAEKQNDMRVMRKYFNGGFDPPAMPRK